MAEEREFSILGQPLPREESLVCTRRRHEMTITLKSAVKKDGTILGVKGQVLSETGAYNGTGPLATYLATTFLNLPWKIPNVKVDSYLIYTNLPPSGPQRGHGVLQMRYAADCHLDLIAKGLNIDPLEIRLKNAVHQGYRTANNMNVKSCGIVECLKQAAERIKWKEKKGKLPPYHGIGIAGMGYLSGCNLVPHTGAAAIVHVHEDGGISLLTGAAEIGQGSIHMGAGHVLTEDVVMKEGRVMNPNLLEYKIPTPFEMPFVHGIAVESESDEIGPYGAKECGEGTEVSTLPAIVNAIHDATGIMFKDLPVTPDKVLRALKKREKGGN